MVPGFAGAPATKGLMMLAAFNSVAISTLSWKQYAHLQLVPHLTVYHQYWRILTHYFSYTDSAELLLGTIITYGCFPEVERRLGTRRFLSLILRAWLLHALLLLLALSISVTLSSTLNSVSRWFQLPWVLSRGVASDGPIPIIVVVFLHHIRISPGSWTIQIGKALQTDENGLLALLLLVLAMSRRAAVLSCLISLLIAGACWPTSGRRSTARRLSSHKGNRGLGASSLDLVQRTLSSFARYLLLVTPIRIAVHMVLQLIRGAIGDTPKPPRSSRAERRRDPIIFPPATASARQGSPQFSLRIPQLQLNRFNALMRQSNGAPTDAEEGAQAQRSPILPFFGPVLGRRRTIDESEPSGGAEAEASERSEPLQSPSVQPPAFLANFLSGMQRPSGGMFEAQITSLHGAFPSRSREQILQALQESNGSHSEATERLLASS